MFTTPFFILPSPFPAQEMLDCYKRYMAVLGMGCGLNSKPKAHMMSHLTQRCNSGFNQSVIFWE
eukprot:11958227-Alexandrium_andersonii.AAC.1